ncbi:hypothetical protein CLOP_g23105 [Closterium sp. NIES-67]|nr:hypothetical protein CLOP_g23105 [Closterium sp. NIES-67]
MRSLLRRASGRRQQIASILLVLSLTSAVAVLWVGYRAGREMEEGGGGRRAGEPGSAEQGNGEGAEGNEQEREGWESAGCEGRERARSKQRSAFPRVTADMIAVAERYKQGYVCPGVPEHPTATRATCRR